MVENTTHRKDFNNVRNNSFRVAHLETKTLKKDLVEALIVLSVRQQERAEKEQKLAQAQSMRAKFDTSSASQFFASDMTIQHLDFTGMASGSGGFFEAAVAMVDDISNAADLELSDVLNVIAEMRDQKKTQMSRMAPHVKAELEKAGVDMQTSAGMKNGMNVLRDRLDDVNVALSTREPTISVSNEMGIIIPDSVISKRQELNARTGYKRVSPRVASGIGVA